MVRRKGYTPSRMEDPYADGPSYKIVDGTKKKKKKKRKPASKKKGKKK